MIRVTFDTNVVPARDAEKKRLKESLARHPGKYDIAVVSVTEREVEGTDVKVTWSSILETAVWGESRWGQAVWAGEPIRETFVTGESRLGEGIIGGVRAPADLETILLVISNGGFPKAGNRSTLSKGQRNQLRDAMILEAHLREKRDLLVSNDYKAFGAAGSERRARLEERFGTKILSLEEFYQALEADSV